MSTSIKQNNKFKFGTKAETLERLSSIVTSAVVDPVVYFSVAEWREESAEILKRLGEAFNCSVVVRSSACCEDTHDQSMAGAFHSCLDVNGGCEDALREAIDDVIRSYDDNVNNHILVQPMVSDVAVSGVIMTRNLQDGGPYYVVNYDDNSGKTDSITGGTGVHKTVYISRNHHREYIESGRLRQMVDLAVELEKICDSDALDIEFGIDRDNTVHLFQVRPISLTSNWINKANEKVEEYLPKVEKAVVRSSESIEGIFGDSTILANMPDWNPAEMIGVIPKPLAASLYGELITDSVWSLARQEMGYRVIPDVKLMELVCGRSYIDVRNSFNSFLPKELDVEVMNKLVNAWLGRLNEFPELHDKVEFDIVPTCLDFTFDESFNERYDGVLTTLELENYKKSLFNVTDKCLDLTEAGSLHLALKRINELKKIQDDGEADCSFNDLLGMTKKLGTLPFSILARHGFIAESFLRSAVKKGVISENRVQQFKTTISTVTTEMAQDLQKLGQGELTRNEFLNIYGHLRPGTYDITSLSYKDRDDLFHGTEVRADHCEVEPFLLSADEEEGINVLLNEAGFETVTARELLRYVEKAIIGREYGKFVFTKSVSKIIDELVLWGEEKGLSRRDVSYLTLEDIKKNNEDYKYFIDEKIELYNVSKNIELSYIVRGVADVYVVPVHRSAPNFISDQHIEGEVRLINASTKAGDDIDGKIICIENADPGFDWIFTKNIKGLITQYGGANSHMAIRCAEFGLPAAIGCGKELFQRVIDNKIVDLDCRRKNLKPMEFHK